MSVKNSFEKNYARSTGAVNSKGISMAVGDASKDRHRD